jgi:hypothetical protein
MNRRPRLPGADELFRATGGAAALSAGAAGAAAPAAATPGPTTRGRAPHAAPARAPRVSRALQPAPDSDWEDDAGVRNTERDTAPERFDDPRGARPGGARPVRITRRSDVRQSEPTGRERHDEKITVYCSPEELLQLEHARLALRGSHGLAVDRGRIVREAVAVVLADLEAKGDASILVRRLRGR